MLEFGILGEKNNLDGMCINVYNITMNERMQAIKALEKAGYFLKRHRTGCNKANGRCNVGLALCCRR